MFEIEVPPLRNRLDDIPPLVAHFLEIFSKKYHKPGIKLPASLMGKLQKYHWPGNIRELKNSMERAVILDKSGKITADSIFPPQQQRPTEDPAKRYDLIENEKRLILDVIQKNRGNMTRTAKDLGLERTALYRRIKKYGL